MVDIIIPVYNALDTLELAVTSALMQGDVRILLVDDGSTDGTARLCDELAHHPRIEVIHQRNHGVSAARNAGLQAAASEWLTFLDADDVLLPDAIGHLLALAGDSQAIQGLVTRSEAPDVPECTVQTLPSRDMLDLALRNPTVHLHTHGWLLRREICNERFNESLRLGEDGEWMMRVLRGTKTVARAQVNAYCYHLRADSAVHSAADVVREYLRTLTAAQPTLNCLTCRTRHTVPLDAPAADADARGGAGGRLRDGLRQCGAIRRLCGKRSARICARVRWLPRSKAQAVLLMLRCGLYPLARRAILIRRRQNQQACGIGRKRNIIGRDFSRQDVLRTARGKSAVTCGLSRAGRPYPSLRRRFHQLKVMGTSALARR